VHFERHVRALLELPDGLAELRPLLGAADVAVVNLETALTARGTAARAAKRSAAKPLWPLHWSNSCCSHPRQGESVEAAAQRRLTEELGLSAKLRLLYKFEYQAAYGQVGSEHELCWVFAGFTDEEPHADAGEIAAWRHVSPGSLDTEIAANPAAFTPWLKLEWADITARYLPQLLAAADRN
jgi:isopentenyl-diphosphate delta-isomerase type 1